jgi:hypothetical protein
MLKKKTISFYDWSDVAKELKANTGKEYRNWAGKTYGVGTVGEDRPYQDFWHVICNSTDMGNGIIDNYFNPEEVIECWDDRYVPAGKDPKDSEWQLEVWQELLKILGPGEHKIRYSW